MIKKLKRIRQEMFCFFYCLAAGTKGQKKSPALGLCLTPMKINLLSKLDLAEENRKSRSNGKIEPVFNRWAAFCGFPRIGAVFSGTSLTMKDSTE